MNDYDVSVVPFFPPFSSIYVKSNVPLSVHRRELPNLLIVPFYKLYSLRSKEWGSKFRFLKLVSKDQWHHLQKHIKIESCVFSL